MARPDPKPAHLHVPTEPLFTTNFVLACLITLSSFTSFYFLLATLPPYLATIGGNDSQVGLIIGVFSLTAIFLRPLVGAAADTRGRRWFIVAGNAVMALASALYGLITSVLPLLGLRILHGAGFASFGTATSALVADVVPRSRRGEAMGYYGMSNNLAMAVGPALGIELMRSFSFGAVFGASAVVALLSFALSLMVREPRRSPPAPAPGFAAGGLIERSALFPAAVLALTAATYGSIVSFLVLYAGKQGVENPGLFFTVYALVLLAARSFTGQLSDRFGRAVVITPGLLLVTVALWLLSVAASLPVFLAVAVLYGLAFAAVQPATMALVVDHAPAHRRGAAMGTFSMAMDLGIGGGSIIWGFVAQAAGYQAMYLASGTVGLLAAAVFLAGWRAHGR